MKSKRLPSSPRILHNLRMRKNNTKILSKPTLIVKYLWKPYLRYVNTQIPLKINKIREWEPSSTTDQNLLRVLINSDHNQRLKWFLFNFYYHLNSAWDPEEGANGRIQRKTRAVVPKQIKVTVNIISWIAVDVIVTEKKEGCSQYLLSFKTWIVVLRNATK